MWLTDKEGSPESSGTSCIFHSFPSLTSTYLFLTSSLKEPWVSSCFVYWFWFVCGICIQAWQLFFLKTVGLETVAILLSDARAQCQYNCSGSSCRSETFVLLERNDDSLISVFCPLTLSYMMIKLLFHPSALLLWHCDCRKQSQLKYHWASSER